MHPNSDHQRSGEAVTWKALIEQAKSGDQEAFRQLVEGTRARLEALVHVRLGPRARQMIEPDDVLQETYLRVYQGLSRFRCRGGREGFFRWVARIAERVILQLVRHHFHTKKRVPREINRARSVRVEASVLLAALPAVSISPSRCLIREERFDRLEQAFGELRRDHREIIILSRFHRLSMNEIASRMNRSVEAASMLLMRAVRSLRERMGSTDSFSLPPHRLAALFENDRASENVTRSGGDDMGERAGDGEVEGTTATTE